MPRRNSFIIFRNDQEEKNKPFEPFLQRLELYDARSSATLLCGRLFDALDDQFNYVTGSLREQGVVG